MTPEEYVDSLAATGWFDVLPDPAAARADVLEEAKRLDSLGQDVKDAALDGVMIGHYDELGDYEQELLRIAEASYGLFKPEDIMEHWGETMRFRFVMGDNKFGVKRAEHEDFAAEIFPSLVLNAGRLIEGRVCMHPVPLDRDSNLPFVWATDETVAAARAAGLLPWDEAMEPVIRDILMIVADLPGMDHLAPEDGFSFEEMDGDEDEDWDDDDLDIDDDIEIDREDLDDEDLEDEEDEFDDEEDDEEDEDDDDFDDLDDDDLDDEDDEDDR